MVFIESLSTNPAFNLALEEYVFETMPKDWEYFMLWQNHNTIVVGKHQNTVEEINIPYVKEAGIQVVRRLSGGGAVYHDMGNVNFTFIADAQNIDTLNLQTFCIPVIRTLEKLGVDARLSGRNDITIGGKKFSGNSQYIKNGRIMHHGTLMFDSDLAVVAEALNVSKDKIESKGYKSVRSRVTNIRPHLNTDISIENFKQILKESMIQDGDIQSYCLTGADLANVEQLKVQRYDTWDWNYGESPRYQIKKSRRIEGCGKIEVSMNVEGGKITAYESQGDYFGDGATETLKELLKGCLLEEQALRGRLLGFPLELCYTNLAVESFIQLLLL